MKLPGVFTLALLPVLCLGARRLSDVTFENYHAKSQSSAPLRLDDASYDDLTATPRNHSVVVLLTALEARFGCQLCRDFQSEWDLLGKGWAKGDRHGDSRILLGTLDFSEGKGTFQKVAYCEASYNACGGWTGLTATPSSCYKRLPSFYYFHPQQVRMRSQTGSQFDMILRLGKLLCKSSMAPSADLHDIKVPRPPSKWLLGSVVTCPMVPNPQYSDH